MLRKISVLTFVLVLSLVFALPAFAKPNFQPAIYADGKLFSTQGLATLPPPNDDKNLQSFDKLFKIINSNNPEGQPAVAEAGPGNPNFNGGRWYTQTVEWTQAGFDAHGIVPVLKSYDDVLLHESLGHLIITPGSPDGSPTFFLCPLLPVK